MATGFNFNAAPTNTLAFGFNPPNTQPMGAQPTQTLTVNSVSPHTHFNELPQDAKNHLVYIGVRIQEEKNQMNLLKELSKGILPSAASQQAVLSENSDLRNLSEQVLTSADTIAALCAQQEAILRERDARKDALSQQSYSLEAIQSTYAYNQHVRQQNYAVKDNPLFFCELYKTCEQRMGNQTKAVDELEKILSAPQDNKPIKQIFVETLENQHENLLILSSQVAKIHDMANQLRDLAK